MSTIKVCASRVNYHTDYVRRVSRKETGISFSDYLAKYRLKVGKNGF